ncbi:MAG: hypothetical protein QW128_01850 [Thermoprotei archaeon]
MTIERLLVFILIRLENGIDKVRLKLLELLVIGEGYLRVKLNV